MQLSDTILNPVFLVPITVVLFGSLFYYIWRSSKARALRRSLEFSLYEVSFPRSQKEEGQTFKDAIAGMEQFYAGMVGVKPYFVLEIVSPATERETNFYVAVPRHYVSFLEKQVHSVFPTAEIREEKSDYNIFKYKAPTMGAVALLKKNDVLPVKTYGEFTSDPLEVIANTFSTLTRKKEGAAVQIIVDTGGNSFQEEVSKAAKKIESGEPLESAIQSRGKSFVKDFAKVATGGTMHGKTQAGMPTGLSSAIEDTARGEIVNLLKKKASKPILRANVRLLVSADHEERALGILKEMKSAFEQFTEPQGNNFVVYDVGGPTLKKLFHDFSFRLFNAKRAAYLNTAELTSIFHFPAHKMSAPRVKTISLKKSQPPAKLPEEGLLLGVNNFRDAAIEIRVGPDDRRRHFYLVGQTGTGKSVLLENMIYQDIIAGRGVCFIDPHGDSVEKILGKIPAKRWDDVVYFNPADIKRPLGLNMLEYDLRYPEQKTFIVNELLEIFDKLYNMSVSGGPMFEQYFRNATLLVMDDPGSGNTLLEIARVLSDAEFRKYKLLHCKDPVVKSFWVDAAEKAGGEAALQNMVPYITSKFDTFLTNEIVRPIIAQEKSSFDFREIMDSNKIFLINLSKGRLGDLNAHLLGMILVGRIFMAAMSRVDIPEAQRQDFYLYIDEFQNVTTKTIANILSEARKYRLNLIVAHQFIGQLEEEIKKAVFGNVGSMAVFRIGAEDAEFLGKQFEPIFSRDDLLNIPNFNAYIKLLINGETSDPFNIETLPPKASSKTVTGKVKEASSISYGRPLSEIEAEIGKRYAKGIMGVPEEDEKIEENEENKEA